MIKDFMYIVAIISAVTLQVIAEDELRLTNAIQDTLVSEKMLCANTLSVVFNEATNVSNRLKRCEKRRRHK